MRGPSRLLDAAAAQAVAADKALENERVAVQACQARLEAAAREVIATNDAADKARSAANKAGEEAAELRGQLAGKGQPAAEKKPEKGAGK